MKKAIAKLFLSLMIIGGLSACGSTEDNAQVKYDEAFRVEQAGRQADAETLYRSVIGEFPGTPSAQQAQTQLGLLQQKQLRELKRQAADMLDSLQLVVEGYHSVFRQWPQSAKDFDKPDYLFDSDYMAQAVNEGFTVYLALAGAAGRNIWSFPEQGGIGYRLNEASRSIVEVDRAATLTELETAYRVELQKGALVFLVPRS